MNLTSLLMTRDFDHHALLQKVNDEKVIHLLPVIISVIVIMILGILGNSLVCYIYYFKMKKTPSHYFVLFLASLDLVSCCIGMPAELMDLFMPYTFTKPFACKFLRFVLSFTIISSCITLICVAFDRYYKVCHPLRGFPIRKVQLLCGVAIIIGVLLSWPALVLYGSKTVETPISGFYGHECSTSDAMRATIFPLVYTLSLFAAYVITFTIFAILYIRIGMEIRKRKNISIGEKVSPAMRQVFSRKSEVTTSMLSDEESTSAVSEEDKKLRPNRSSFAQLRDFVVQHIRPEENDINKSIGDLNQSNILSTNHSKKKNLYRTLRTTYIFLAVFLAFLVSFLPYLIINFLKFRKIIFYDFRSDSEELVYNFCVRSYFLSNFVNPIIYSVLNTNFRKECKKLFKGCCCNAKNRDSINFSR